MKKTRDRLLPLFRRLLCPTPEPGPIPMILRVAALATLLPLSVPSPPAIGQLPPASAAVLGTANNYTARARGFSSLSLNPAGLGMPGSPKFSLALLPVQGTQTMDPVSLSDLADVGGRLIPAPLKEEWLERIAAAGMQNSGGHLAVTGLAVNYELVGLQFSTIASGSASLNEAAAELLLFGNAGRRGMPGDLNLQGSRINGFGVSTLAVSAALPLNARPMPGVSSQALALGATLKRSWGHFLVVAEDLGTLTRSTPLEVEVRFPILHTDPESEGHFDRGTGLGLDLGVAWEGGGWSAAAVVENVFHTFEWDLETMLFRPGEALFNEDTRESDFDERPASQAPEALRQMVADLTFKPLVALGIAREASETLTLSADFRHRLGEGMDIRPRTHLGAGFEYRPAPSFPLRGGVAVITEGFQLGGGLGLALGRVHLGLAGLIQRGDGGNGTTAMLALSWGGS